MGRDARVTEAGDYRFFAGWRSDPFFFDTLGALNNLQFTGDDFFADKDVCSIVLEVPNSALGWKNGSVASHAVRCEREMGSGRSRRAALAVGLPYRREESAYIAGEPEDDARFVAVFAHSLEHTGGYTPEDAIRVARTLLPDILFLIPRARRPSRTMAEHLLTTSWMYSLRSSPMGR